MFGNDHLRGLILGAGGELGKELVEGRHRERSCEENGIDGRE